MGKEEWSVDFESIFHNFSNFEKWYDVDTAKYVGVLYGADRRIEKCIFLSDEHLKQSFFEYVTNSQPADLTFVGIMVIEDREPESDITYMGPGLEITVSLSDLQSRDITKIIESNPQLQSKWEPKKGLTIVSKVSFHCVVGVGNEETGIKHHVEKFAASTGELAFFHKGSGTVLQARIDAPKALDTLIKGVAEDNFVVFHSYRRITGADENNSEDQAHVPVVKVQKDGTPVTRVDLTLEITCPAYLGESTQTAYLRLEEACRRRAYNALYVMLKGVRKTGKLGVVEAKTFQPPGSRSLLAVILPQWPEKEQKAWRVQLHKLYNLSSRMPALRDAQALKFLANSSLLRNPHTHINYKPIGKVATVQGAYDYHHYMQDQIDDNGWGCAYRSLQTIWSWYRLNGFTDKPVLKHREIQESLVRIEGEDIRGKNFVGSRKWIGSFEIGYVLSDELGIETSYIGKNITLAQFDDISEKARELLYHFETVGTPVMIGGNMLAHTILGVDFCEESGECKFLVLDPHYTGSEDIKVITNKGWCAWKPPTFWKKGIDAGGMPIMYNIVKPQVPQSSL